MLIAGEKKSVPSKAVTLKVAVNSPGIPKPVVVKDTYHAVAGRRALDLAPDEGQLRGVQGRELPRH